MTKTIDQEVIQADRELVDCIMCDDPAAPDFEYAYREVAAHRMTERAAIVAWLIRQAVYYTEIDEGYHANAVSDAADAIERGGHMETIKRVRAEGAQG